MSKVRVLHIINSMENGGMQSYLITLEKAIDREKYQFDFLVYNDNPLYYEEIRQMGGNIYICPKAKTYVGKFIKRVIFKFNLYRNEKFNVVQVHAGTPALPYLGLIEKISGIKYRIFHCHCSKREMSTIGNLFTNISRILMNANYSDFIAVSEKAAEWGFSKKRIRAKDYIYLPDGIIVERFSYNQESRDKIRTRLGIENDLIIGNIGRFTNQKNQLFLIDIVSKLCSYNERIKLLIIGEGALEQDLREKARELGVENNVIFFGTTKDIPSVLSAMDVFVFPSVFEGLGIVAIEAQANGLVVIASDQVPTEAKVTDNYISLSLNEGTEIWEKNILEALAKGRSPDKEKIRKSIAAHGYDITYTVDMLSKYYDKVKK